MAVVRFLIWRVVGPLAQDHSGHEIGIMLAVSQKQK